MTQKNYEQDSYGVYLITLIKKHNFSQSEFAKQINVSRTYLFDLINGRVKPPTPEMQERIVSVLGLTGNEKDEFFNTTATGRNEIPKDVFDFLYNNTNEIAIIRERMRA